MIIPTSLGDAISLLEENPADSREHRAAERYVIEMARRNTIALNDVRNELARTENNNAFVAWLMARPEGTELRRQYETDVEAALNSERRREVRLYGRRRA